MRILATLAATLMLTLLSSCGCSNCPGYDPKYLDDVPLRSRSNF